MEEFAGDESAHHQSPQSFTDQTGREITIERDWNEPTPLVEMYEEFENSAQGVPPRTRPKTEEWVEYLLDEGLNVVATHETPVGHAVLIPYDDTSELAIFVHPDYQSAGIGTELIKALLEMGTRDGIDHVWLTVTHDNRIAMRLYRSAGFEIRETDRGEFEMERALSA